MPFEIKILAWGCVLALVHIFAAGHVRTRQYGKEWNVGARDEAMPPLSPLAGRLVRAQANFFETFPIIAAGLLIDGLLPLSGPLSSIGGALWLGARIVYLPLYAAGIPVVRTLVWSLGLLGIGLVFWPILVASFSL